MEEKNKSKSIVEAGIMSAITFVLMMLTSLPGIGTIISFAIPIPIALLYLKYNLKTSICSIVISGILIGFFMGSIYGIQLAITNGIIGLVLGTCVKKKFSGIKSFIYLIVANTIGVLIEIALLFSVFTFNQYINDLVNVFNEAAKISEQMIGSSQANTQVIELMKSMDASFIINMIPMVLVVVIIMRAFLSYTVGKYIINKLGFKLNSLPPFSKWFFNPILIAAVVLINLFVMLLVSKGVISNKGMYMLTLNLLFAMLIIQGLAVVSNLLKYRYRFSNFLIVFISILMVTSIPQLFGILGLVDVLIDIRGVDPNSLGSYIKEKLKRKLQ
ncbi:YybS family protein [Clostridium perfringens]|uniref:YybS family protein n=1 Tax=Clostridium perfringens TaxID=1502 RepID=UPI0039ED770A